MSAPAEEEEEECETLSMGVCERNTLIAPDFLHTQGRRGSQRCHLTQLQLDCLKP